MKTSKVVKQTVQYEMLNEAQCREIAAAAFRILSRTGCIIQNGEARQLLKEAGCIVDGEKVWIPEHVIRQALDWAPKSVTLYDRDGDPSVKLEPGEAHFGPVTNTCELVDVRTGQRRATVKKDLEEATFLIDALDNIEWSTNCVTLSDVDEAFDDVEEVHTLLTYSHKPFWYYAKNMDSLRVELEMFAAVAGGADAFRRKPFTINLICPLDALRHSDNGMDQVMACARAGAPVVYIPGTEFGLTAPATMAGCLAAGIADLLPGLVVSQLACKGAPFIASCFRNNVDFATMKLNHSRPEMIAANCATADIWRYLGLPFCSNMANTDNGDFGPQAVFEKTAQYYSVLLSGTNMAYGVGCYEAGMVLRFADLVFSDEVIGYLKNLVCGVEVTDEELAEDLIDEVGPGGTYILEEHTAEHVRDFWTPKYLLPKTMGEGKDLEERLAGAALDIIEKGPQHLLFGGKKEAIDALMEQVRASHR